MESEFTKLVVTILKIFILAKHFSLNKIFQNHDNKQEISKVTKRL